MFSSGFLGVILCLEHPIRSVFTAHCGFRALRMYMSVKDTVASNITHGNTIMNLLVTCGYYYMYNSSSNSNYYSYYYFYMY